MDEFRAILDHQSREDEAINGTDSKIHYVPGFARYPFILMLDGIVSPKSHCHSIYSPQTNCCTSLIQEISELC